MTHPWGRNGLTISQEGRLCAPSKQGSSKGFLSENDQKSDTVKGKKEYDVLRIGCFREGLDE